MADIDVVVAGRTYRLGCEDGQERHLATLATAIDAEARTITAQTGLVQEGQLMLMAALILADRLHEATAALSAVNGGSAETHGNAADPAVETAIDKLEAVVDAASTAT